MSREPFGIRRSDTSGPSAVRRARLDPHHPPKRRERAVRQYAGPVSTERSAEAIRAGRRQYAGPVSTERFAESNTRASRRARLDPNHPPKRHASRRAAAGQASNHPPKRYTQAVGHAAGHASKRSPKRYERAVGQAAGPASNRNDMRQPSGKPPGPPRTETICASHRACRRARVEPHVLPREPPLTPRRPPSDPSCKPLPRSRVRSGAQAAAADIEPNPLDYSL